MIKYLKILTEEKERVLNLHKKSFLYELNPNKWGKQLNEGGEIKKPEGDPFAYMKSGDTYYHINVTKYGETPLETDTRWQEETRFNSIEAIKNRIFAADTTTTLGTETTTTSTTMSVVKAAADNTRVSYPTPQALIQQKQQQTPIQAMIQGKTPEFNLYNQ